MTKKRSGQGWSRIERAACHEAGHAIAAILQRRRFKHATIVEQEGATGHVRFFRDENMDPAVVEDDKRIYAKLEREIIISFGGHAAEEVLTGKRYRKAFRSDFESIAAMVLQVHDDVELRDAYFKYLYLKTRELLGRPLNWMSVEAVAKALLERKTLKANEVRLIVEEVRKARWGSVGQQMRLIQSKDNEIQQKAHSA